jgi:predicted metal-dependent hydrolase
MSVSLIVLDESWLPDAHARGVVRQVQRDLADPHLGGDIVGHLGAGQAHQQEHRQDEREFEQRDAAPVAASSAALRMKQAGKPGSCAIPHRRPYRLVAIRLVAEHRGASDVVVFDPPMILDREQPRIADLTV